MKRNYQNVHEVNSIQNRVTCKFTWNYICCITRFKRSKTLSMKKALYYAISLLNLAEKIHAKQETYLSCNFFFVFAFFQSICVWMLSNPSEYITCVLCESFGMVIVYYLPHNQLLKHIILEFFP